MSTPMLFDAVGTAHIPYSDTPRIASLVPSLTELLFALGLGERVVARTHYCVHPSPNVQSIAEVGGTKKVKHAQLRELAPTHVLLNIDENPKALAVQLAEYVPHVVVTHPEVAEDNLALYRLLGLLFGREYAAARLSAAFSRRLLHLYRERPLRRPRRVLYLIWREPWMSISAPTYIAQMLRLINWQCVTLPDPARYPTLDITPELLSQLDYVLFSSEPYHFKPNDLDQFAQCYQFPRERVLLIDAELVSWYGSRAILGLDYLDQLARQHA